jgi:hypothetical protein
MGYHDCSRLILYYITLYYIAEKPNRVCYRKFSGEGRELTGSFNPLLGEDLAMSQSALLLCNRIGENPIVPE